MLDDISEAKVKQFLLGLAEDIDLLSKESLKEFLPNLIGQVILNPATHECQIDYRIAVDLRNKVASPRGFEPLLPG